MSGKSDTTSRGVEDASLNKGGYYGEQPWMYTVLGCPREEFLEYIKNELVRSMAADYVDAIAERIADDVAHDICDTAGPEKWNDCDMRLGIGRVLVKLLRYRE